MQSGWSERWLWRKSCVCRVVLEDLGKENLSQFDEAFGSVLGPVGIPTIGSAHLRQYDSQIELTFDEGDHSAFERYPSFSASLAALRRRLAWGRAPGSLHSLEGGLVWLVGDVEPSLFVELQRHGWSSRKEVLVDADGTVRAGSAQRVEHVGLIRVRRYAGIGATRLNEVEPGEAETWLSGQASELTPQQGAHLAQRMLTARLIYDDVSSAETSLRELGAVVQLASADRPGGRLRTLAVGNGRLRVLTESLGPGEEAQVDYVLQHLESSGGESRDESPKVVAIGRVDGTPTLASMSTQYLRLLREPDFSTLLAHLDQQLQRSLLDLDTSHDILLGSAVCRDGNVVVLTGPRQGGKTTLALHLVRDHGFHLVCDDFVVWDGTAACIVPFAKPMRIRGQAVHHFSENQQVGIRTAASGDLHATWMWNPPCGAPCAHSGRGLLVNCLRSKEPVETALSKAETPSAFERMWWRPPPGSNKERAQLVGELAQRLEPVALHYSDFANAAAVLGSAVR